MEILLELKQPLKTAKIFIKIKQIVDLHNL